jgi:hypothetical protein
LKTILVVQDHEAVTAELRADEARRRAATGRELRLSGRKGEMYELADGSLVCALADGSEVTACCWARGSRLIDHRAGGRSPSGHSPSCKLA